MKQCRKHARSLIEASWAPKLSIARTKQSLDSCSSASSSLLWASTLLLIFQPSRCWWSSRARSHSARPSQSPLVTWPSSPRTTSSTSRSSRSCMSASVSYQCSNGFCEDTRRIQLLKRWPFSLGSTSIWTKETWLSRENSSTMHSLWPVWPWLSCGNRWNLLKLENSVSPRARKRPHCITTSENFTSKSSLTIWLLPIWRKTTRNIWSKETQQQPLRESKLTSARREASTRSQSSRRWRQVSTGTSHSWSCGACGWWWVYRPTCIAMPSVCFISLGCSYPSPYPITSPFSFLVFLWSRSTRLNSAWFT